MRTKLLLLSLSVSIVGAGRVLRLPCASYCGIVRLVLVQTGAGRLPIGVD